MNVKDYINNDFNPIGLYNTVRQIKELFKVLPFTHFPISEGNVFKGMIAQVDIGHYLNEDDEITNLAHLFKTYHINSDTNPLDLLTLFAQYDTDIIPVINDKQEYVGYFELDEIIRLFYKTPFLSQDATTLIIEKESSHLTISEVSQIIESNGIKILGMYISEVKDDKTEVTLRIATENTNEVIQSLRRYDYEVLNTSNNDLLIDQLKERSEYLQKFFGI